MKLVLLGAPGAGKGTLAYHLNKEFNMPHISTGDIFRGLAEEGDEMGVMARDKYWGNGNLVPDRITNELVKRTLEKKEHLDNFILDGFPRTYDQAVALDSFVEDYVPLFLNASQDTVQERILNRLTCTEKCGRIYNSVTQIPKYPRKCECGAELKRRKDDNKDTLIIRLEEYNANTPGILMHYGERTLEIDAEQSPEKVLQEASTLIYTNP